MPASSAVESADVMRRAFRADMVDEGLRGDWDDVCRELDLEVEEEEEEEGGPRRAPASPPRTWMQRLAGIGGLAKAGTKADGDSASRSRRDRKLRQKRKSSRKARKRNRKK